jgi:hypothetical protein
MESSSRSFPSDLHRGKDWIFHAIWTSVEDPQIPRFTQRLPLTFIFHGGLPTKALSSDASTGFAVRIPLNTALGKGKDPAKAPLSRMKASLKDFQARWKFDRDQLERQDSIFLATAIYGDGEEEHLDEATLDMLLRNAEWRKQVSLLQAHIPARSKQKGFYAQNQRTVRSLLDTAGSEAADMTAKAMVRRGHRMESSLFLRSFSFSFSPIEEICVSAATRSPTNLF